MLATATSRLFLREYVHCIFPFVIHSFYRNVTGATSTVSEACLPVYRWTMMTLVMVITMMIMRWTWLWLQRIIHLSHFTSDNYDSDDLRMNHGNLVLANSKYFDLILVVHICSFHFFVAFRWPQRSRDWFANSSSKPTSVNPWQFNSLTV